MKMKFFLIITFFSLSYSNFIAMNNGARSLAMGNTFIPLKNNSESIFYNPAGIAMNNQFILLGSHQKLYGLKDVYNDMMVISIPTPLLRSGFAIQQTRLLNVYKEQIVYISFASIIRIKNIPIRFGSSIKFSSVKVENYESANDPSNYDLDFGMLTNLTSNLFISYSMQNILQPSFKFISISEKIKSRHRLGLCYEWRNSVNFITDYVFTDMNDGQWNLGSEIWFFDVFAARIGIYNEKLTIGFGLKTNNWLIDTAILSNEKLGSTYRISMGIHIDNLLKRKKIII